MSTVYRFKAFCLEKYFEFFFLTLQWQLQTKDLIHNLTIVFCNLDSKGMNKDSPHCGTHMPVSKNKEKKAH